MKPVKNGRISSHMCDHRGKAVNCLITSVEVRVKEGGSVGELIVMSAPMVV